MLLKQLFLVSKITPESTELSCYLLSLEILVLRFLKCIRESITKYAIKNQPKKQKN